MDTINKLLSVEETIKHIQQGKALILAAEEDILDQLPRGNWIGGTIPYFMDVSGGCISHNKVFVTNVSSHSINTKIALYDVNNISTFLNDRYEHGYSFILIPGFSEVLAKFAIIAQNLPELYNTPVIGWVTGIDLNNVGKVTPKIYNGKTGEKTDSKAILLHVELPQNKIAGLEILNIFEQGNAETYEFIEEGFTCTDCLINGEKKNLADYIVQNKINTKLPLVADYSGAMINISFQQIDEENKSVLFYAPLRKNTKYKLAKEVDDYVKSFNSIIPSNIENLVVACNCILNFLYSELEGKKTANINGPFTFGEIAYLLVNQTMVYLNIVDNY